jgi:hypothetical protein
MKKLSIKQLLILVLIVDIVLCGAFVLTNILNKPARVERQISESNIQRICELATLECYYHNVSNWSQDAYGVLAFTGYGEKKVWIEYDGMVRVGINAGGIKISDPDKDDIITVTMPAATILDKDLDESTISEISSDRTVLFFTDQVNTEDRRKALAAAQEDMEESASKNEMILGEAQERAKKIIERNILAAGEASGKHYKVKFVDASETQTVVPNKEETP